MNDSEIASIQLLLVHIAHAPCAVQMRWASSVTQAASGYASFTGPDRSRQFLLCFALAVTTCHGSGKYMGGMTLSSPYASLHPLPHEILESLLRRRLILTLHNHLCAT